MSNNKIQLNNNELQQILNDINNLPEVGGDGIDTSDATASASDILKDKTAYVNGQKITGTIITVDPAAPIINVSSSGLITATTTQAKGYVEAGTETVTEQLSVQVAKTITPTKSSQTAVAAGKYTTGTVTVGAIPDEYITTDDANAVAGDIMEGQTAYVDGSKLTGTFTLDSESSTQDTLIANIAAALEGKTSGEGYVPVLQNKIITENGEYVADEGFDGLGIVTVNVGSDGGSETTVETVEVALETEMLGGDGTVYYLDQNLQYQMVNNEMIVNVLAITVVKNSIVTVSAENTVSVHSSFADRIVEIGTGTSTYKSFLILGSGGTIYYY